MLLQLKYNDFEVKNIEAYKMDFKNENTVNYSQIPRRKNLLHLVTGGRRRYEINGKIFSVEKGTLIFIPHNTKYITTAISIEHENCSGIGICFDINIPFFEKESDVYYTQDIKQRGRVLDLFKSVYETQKNDPLEFLELKLAFYRLLSLLISPETVESQEYTVIKPAIDFINNRYKENLPVKIYADECTLSESYFRKIFCECFGKSPIEYRNQLRFIEAKRL